MELKQVNGNSHDVEGRTGGAKEETEIKMEDILEEIGKSAASCFAISWAKPCKWPFV